jgi:hypothetical protein
MADNDKKRTRRRFTDEFKRNAVEVVRTTGKPIAQVARDLGVPRPRWAAGSPRTASTAANARD